MIVPIVELKKFKKYGFKKCKGEYGKQNCYYLCVSRGIQMIFLSPKIVDIMPWEENDPRVHTKPNCRYRDTRTALEIVLQLVKHGMIDVKLF